jgi:Type IIB DNA topoisomerase
MNDNTGEVRTCLKKVLLQIVGKSGSFPDNLPETFLMKKPSEQDINEANGRNPLLAVSCLHYAQVTGVAGIVAELVGQGKSISLRDVYYSLKPLFKSQAECNSIILELGCVLGLRRCKGYTYLVVVSGSHILYYHFPIYYTKLRYR